MACRFEVTLAASGAHLLDAARAALDEASRIETALTVFCASSELSYVNRHAGSGPVAVGAELFSLLERCRGLHQETDGAFDITTTPLSRCWGFLARAPHVPLADDIDAARRSVGMRHVRLDTAAHTVSFARPDVELNLGSIGKGYALDAMSRAIRRPGVTHALLSAGGSSLLVVGARRVWAVDVTSPQVMHPIARLELSSGALGTSGQGEQFTIADGRRYGHVIDPSTGRPTSGVLTASVVTGDAESADALSTAFPIGGPALAERYCRDHPDTLAFVTPDERPLRTLVFGRHRGARLEVRHAHA